MILGRSGNEGKDHAAVAIDATIQLYLYFTTKHLVQIHFLPFAPLDPARFHIELLRVTEALIQGERVCDYRYHVNEC
jgi:hypothetical protein